MGNKTLIDKIKDLEKKIKDLEDKISQLTQNTTAKRQKPETKISQADVAKPGKPLPSTGTGLGQISGRQGSVVFNDAEAQIPSFNSQPNTPQKGYNKHSHSRYSGGALDINTLELVEYQRTAEAQGEEGNPDYIPAGVILGSDGLPLNEHCQNFWRYPPTIALADDGETPKIGNLDIEFDATSGKWIAGSQYIDVETTYLVQYDYYLPDNYSYGNEVSSTTEGAVRMIKLDENGNQMKSPLLVRTTEDTPEARNIALEKTNSYWDKDNQTWRIYGTFKPIPEEE